MKDVSHSGVTCCSSQEYKWNYREHVVREFLRDGEGDSSPGENPSIRSHYTALTIIREPWSGHGAECGAVGCANSSNGPATVTAQTLFRPDEDGQTPRVVVLVGAPGMGKTTTVRKVMVEWGEGTLHEQFDCVFCIDCKGIALPKEASVADLVSQCCPHQRVPAGRILHDQKILFIFDGFEALGFSLVQPEAELSSDPREVKPLETTLMSLLKRTVLPEASLLITTRPTALQSLGQCLEGGYYAEILGFSAAMREEYFHRYFENANKANMAFRFARGNEILYSLCVIPVMSWTVCTILERELCRKKNLLECSKATTRMTMSYLSQLLKHRDRDNPQVLQRFLLRLCSLAADGIWKHKVLFEEKEIRDCGLDQPDLLPLFLNEKISKEGGDHGKIYGFTHLHLQEFFAAMFYVLEDDEETVSDLGGLEKDVSKLLKSYSESRKDLNVTVQFLFGLVSQKSIEYVNKTIGCRISPQAREDLLKWLQGRHRSISHPGQALKISELDTFHFLFEMNEKSFAQSALDQFSDLDLQDMKLTLYDQMALSFCIQQWAGLGCITLQGCSFHQQDPRVELDALVPCSGASGAGGRPGAIAELWQEELHCPIHLLCRALRHPGSALRVLRLQWCRLSESCCAKLAALLAEHPSLAQLELGDGALGDCGVRLLCRGLRRPGCRLRVLRLRYSRLTSSCCEDLAAVLGTSPCLEELDLSFSEGLRDAGVQLLCQGLQHHACPLQTLRLGSCRLTGACCPALAAQLLERPHLTCLDLSDNDLGADGVLQLCQQLRHPACPLRTLGLSTDGLSQDVLQELATLRALKPGLKIGNLLEHDVPEVGAMARLPFHRGVQLGSRKALPSFRRAPLL
ncbi:NACHT, LRR and PYD domains-containing protein 12-like [Neopelma chrysocephalum]|uniref:NACHT, LRR and PYD domains-containing protein 12-like n=1 Tax=Neopelma chrysocephalum TaxID=114329 RepID=UPI000FCD33F0|nr:NACHT, LRR and PYD domains-containing protein 12-like [Neopelma chrysocephalum]XP_027552167.1 NACHT, LRR and PYD domains-containing protein 12-like [Neopelma chrysocephalum]XP_027552169.1 NACHT, LRR and PYD domains-containing protein 12-like [Neopelma chrysocephalum]